jgi:hypothetical protein
MINRRRFRSEWLWPGPSPPLDNRRHSCHGSDFRYSGGKAERFLEIAAALVTRGVDVLIASSEPATRAALQATATIPIVMLVPDAPGDGRPRAESEPAREAT